MGIPQLNSCCGCFSLRNGTKIIGWLSLVFGIMFIIGLVTTLIFVIHVEDDPRTKDEDKPLLRAFTYLAIVSLFITFIQTAFGFVLLLGAYQGKAKLVYVWVVANSITVILNLIGFTIMLFFALDGGNWTYLVGCALDIYFILVVYSYYTEIQNSPVYSV